MQDLTDLEKLELDEDKLFPYYLDKYYSLSILNDLRDLAFSESKRKGFHTEKPNFGDFIANLHGEVSELWEAYRKGNLDKHCDKAKSMEENGIEPLTAIEEEIADYIIRGFDFAGAFGIDLEKAVRNKLLFNRTRPFRNGNKLA